MSIGNLKTEGGKGTNWPWQYKMLKGLQGIIDVINSTANGSEYEAQLVNITCPDPIVPPAPHAGLKLYLEVRTWDTVSGGFTNISYYLPGSNTAYPAADFAGCTVVYLEAGDATEATLQDILAKATANETNTADIVSNTSGILADTANIEANTNELRNVSNAPTILRATANALVTLSTQVIKSISFYNATTDATNNANVNGVILRQGETVNFDAGGNGNKFPTSSFNYNADPGGVGAGDLLIIYVE